MRPPPKPAVKRPGGFTLIELIMVIAIVAMLASLLMPAFAQVRKRADSLTCYNNLREIGIAVNLYLGEHDNTYPYVETNPGNPIYTSDLEVDAKTMLETFSPYGVTDKVLQCPADMKAQGGFPTYYNNADSSYLWNPVLDGETKTNPLIYGRRGAMQVSPSRIRQVTDGNPVHNSHRNALYGDGHVVSY